MTTDDHVCILRARDPLERVTLRLDIAMRSDPDLRQALERSSESVAQLIRDTAAQLRHVANARARIDGAALVLIRDHDGCELESWEVPQ